MEDLQRRTEESHFYEIYSRILQDIRPQTISDDDISEAIDRVIQSFYWREGHRFSEVDYGRPENVCAYLFRYGTHGAGLARCRVLEAAANCRDLRDVIRTTSEADALKVVSLGGGPGNDVLGFCSALVELGFPKRRGLDVTVVDAIPHWKNCVRALERLAKAEDFGNVTELFRRENVTVMFSCVELPEEDPDVGMDCYDAIGGADVVVMSKLMSTVEFDDKRDLTEDIRSTMKREALLLLIDSPFDPDYWKGFTVLYGPSDVPQVYRLLEAHDRFGYYDDVQSKASISVLTKKC